MDKNEVVHGDMSASVRRLMKAKPIIKQMLKGGEIVQVEKINNDVCAMLDTKAGIDYFQVYDDEKHALNGVVWGIASRFQVGKSWETFTIREERESGATTEYEKRKKAIERDGEYPYLNIHGYVTKSDEEIISIAIARTKDIFKCIEAGLCTRNHTNPDQVGQSGFIVVEWDTVKRQGYPIVIYSDGEISAYKDGERL